MRGPGLGPDSPGEPGRGAERSGAARRGRHGAERRGAARHRLGGPDEPGPGGCFFPGRGAVWQSAQLSETPLLERRAQAPPCTGLQWLAKEEISLPLRQILMLNDALAVLRCCLSSQSYVRSFGDGVKGRPRHSIPALSTPLISSRKSQDGGGWKAGAALGLRHSDFPPPILREVSLPPTGSTASA